MEHKINNCTERKLKTMRLENDLKPHNKVTYEKVKSILQTNNKTCAIQPTGSGKSYIILKLLEDYAEQGRDIIVIEPRKYIFEQLQKKIKKYGLSSSNIIFCTYSALGKMNDEKIKQFNYPKMVIVDEMHSAGAPKWGLGLQMMFNSFPNDCKYIGLSATPIRYLDKRRNMAEELFDGCIANEIGLADAILNRLLPLPRYIAGLYTYENEFNAITNKIQSSHNTDKEKEELLQEVAVMKKNLDKSKGISSIFKKYINQDKGKYIAFCRDIDHLNLMKSCLEQWFSEAGITCNLYEVHCKNPEKDDQFNAFMDDNKLAVCLSVAMLSEGVHGFDGVILLRDTISPNLYYQQIGRAFAVDMDTVPIIFDLVANCESIMECSLKNDLLNAIDKRDKDKMNNEDACVYDGQDSEEVGDSNDCDAKEITKDDIESFFVFDQVIDAVNVFKEIESRIISDIWLKEDEDLVRKYYPSIGINVKSMLSVEKSEKAIYMKARTMGLISKKHRWKEKEKVFLKESYGVLSTREIAEKLNRTEKSIHKMARKLNLKKLYSNWSNDELVILKKFYPIEGVKVANRLPYKTESQCLTKAVELKIKYIGNKTSKFKYVSWQNQKWRVRFKINGKHKDFGCFDTEEEAGKVAMEKAREYGKAT